MATPKIEAQRLMYDWYKYRMELYLPVAGKAKGTVQSLLDFMHGAHFCLLHEYEEKHGTNERAWDKEDEGYKLLCNFTFHRMMLSTRGLDWARECASEYARVTAGVPNLETLTRGEVKDASPRRQE